jgi:hypothetical protein
MSPGSKPGLGNKLETPKTDQKNKTEALTLGKSTHKNIKTIFTFISYQNTLKKKKKKHIYIYISFKLIFSGYINHVKVGRKT